MLFYANFTLFRYTDVNFHNEFMNFLCISQYFFKKLLKFVQKYCKI